MESHARVREEALLHLKNGEMDQAMRLAQSGLSQWPEDPRLLEIRGIGQAVAHQIDAATASLEEAALLGPLSFDGQLALAACYFTLNHLGSAACIVEHLASRPDVPGPLRAGLAVGLDRIGKPQRALEVAQSAILSTPHDEALWFFISRLMTKLDYPDEPILEAMRHAFELAPDRVFYRIDLAILLSHTGRLAEGYRLLIAVPLADLLEVHCPPRLLNLAVLFHQVGDVVRAVACQSRLDGAMHA